MGSFLPSEILSVLGHLEGRRFVVSVSGGADSVCLLYLMRELQKEFDFELAAFHMNFNIRGREADLDEALVKKICTDLGVSLRIDKLKSAPASQEAARAERLEYAKKAYSSDWEWLEAHHADDQVETFMFRLLRGSGLHGLAAIRPFSLRDERKVWRPLLRVPKKELVTYLESKGLSYREDSSNKESRYDRNWLRLEVLPQIEERFPKVRKAILRTIEQLQIDEVDWLEEFSELERQVVLSFCPLRLSGEVLKELSASKRARFLHGFFSRRLGLSLGHEAMQELLEKISQSKAFAFNAPKTVVLKAAPDGTGSLQIALYQGPGAGEPVSLGFGS